MKRPLSSQHNKTSFGEFYMTKKLEQNPKVTNYRVDGSGRDSYINYDNGGNVKTSSEGWSKYTSKRGYMQYNTKNYNVVSKVSIYKSDGAGRDQYIVQDCGGFYNSGNSINKPITKYSFKNILRSYDIKPTKVLVNDYSNLCKNHINNSEKIKAAEISKSQRVQSARLSVPKRRNQKYEDSKKF
jgi:hypothetical protein